ncbi:2TM domain-containing protein [Caldalkalibacillus salinus]|uniref:2TM domain-containing protein n=1 Tax=Caldalkalibacillus salinus TaxID=2803787 RepID=UPI001922A864|nr:2TM domain-containing protein [Caldalkalibacillus salinus]
MDHDERYLRAKKKVENLKGFYIHSTVYILVNIMLFFINFFTFEGEWWFIFPLMGWGVGLTVHGLVTFASGFFGEGWEERKIQEYMDKDQSGK